VQAAGEDRRLAADLAAGDRAALVELIGRHRDGVARLAARMLHDRDRVDDVVQSVFVAALSGAGRFRGEASVQTWLTRIAIHACRRANRTAVVQRGWTRLISRGPAALRGSEPDDAADPAERFDETRRAAAVRRAVDRLPRRYREVIVLRYLEEWPVDRIAEVLGVKRNTVEQRLSRARRALEPPLRELGAKP